MEFLEPRGLRFEEALEEFLCGKCMAYRGVNFWIAPDGYLEARVHPDWSMNRDEPRRSSDDLCFSRRVCEEISSQSKLFASAVENLPWRLIKLDQSGTEVVYLYYPDEGQVIWSLGGNPACFAQ